MSNDLTNRTLDALAAIQGRAFTYATPDQAERAGAALDLLPELAAELDRLQRFSALVEQFITERAEYITVLENSTEADSDYGRWQGHAESRRQLLAMLPWPADTDDAERISKKARVTR